MSNVNVNLAGAMLQVYDLAANLFRLSVPEATLTLAGTEAKYEAYAQIAGGGGTVFTIPGGTAWFVWVRNLAASGSGLNLTVIKQVTGGALLSAANSEVLTPGGLYVYAQPSEGAGGIIALTLVGSSTLPAEVLIAY